MVLKPTAEPSASPAGGSAGAKSSLFRIAGGRELLFILNSRTI